MSHTPASLYATFPGPEARRLFDTLRARLFRKAGGFALIYITVTESFRNWGAEKKSGRPCNRNPVGRR
jgi:hypothetical protein